VVVPAAMGSKQVRSSSANSRRGGALAALLAEASRLSLTWQFERIQVVGEEASGAVDQAVTPHKTQVSGAR